MSNRQQPNITTRKHLDRLHREQRQTRMIIGAVIVMVVAVVAILVYGYLDSNILRYKKPVAIINGEKIMGDEFRGFTKYYRYSIIKQAESTLQYVQMFGNEPSIAQQISSQLQNYASYMVPTNAGKAALDQMIEAALIKQEAQKRGITVTSDEIEARMKEMMEYFPNGTPTPANTSLPPAATSTLNATQASMLRPTATEVVSPTAALTETLALTQTVAPAAPTSAPTATLEATFTPTASAPITPTATPQPTLTPTPYTLEGYQGAVATLKADLLTNYEIPDSTLTWIIESGLYREKLSKIVVGDLPCKQPQVWAQHILVPDASLAAVIATEAKSGEDWYALAAKYSTDSTKDNGGDLGWFGPGAMVKEFEDAAFSLEVGQISDPVKSQFGYHIIRVLGKEDRPLTSQECETFKQSEFKKFTDELRANSNVETREDYWETIVPINPVFPPEVQEVINSLNVAPQPPDPQNPVP